MVSVDWTSVDRSSQASKESDMDTVSTRIDAAVSKSASLKKQVARRPSLTDWCFFF